MQQSPLGWHRYQHQVPVTGVGMKLESRGSGPLMITELVDGGAAAASGRIRVRCQPVRGVVCLCVCVCVLISPPPSSFVLVSSHSHIFIAYVLVFSFHAVIFALHSLFVVLHSNSRILVNRTAHSRYSHSDLYSQSSHCLRTVVLSS